MSDRGGDMLCVCQIGVREVSQKVCQIVYLVIHAQVYTDEHGNKLVKQLVRATNDMCVVMYEAAKSNLCTCILFSMQYSHIYTQRDYIWAHSQLFMNIHTQARPVTNTPQSALDDM